MQVMRKLILWAALAFVAAGVSAQVQQARGKASVTYAGPAASADDKARATMNAQLKAVEFYYAEAGQSESANLDAIRDKIKADPDRFFLESTVLGEQDDPAKHQYTVAVRVSLNVANLRNAVKSTSAVVRGGPAGRSQLALMFVSRQVDSTTTFDDRVHKRVDASADVKGHSSIANKGTEGESVGRSQVSTNESTSTKGSATVSTSRTLDTGGSTTRMSAESTWKLMPSSNLAQIFSSTFATSGFKVSEASMIEPYTGGRFHVADVEKDYRSGMDLKAATLASMVAGMRTAQIPYIALGTLDVGMADKDPETGLMRVSVTVNGKLLDISQTIPDTIASVGPVQYSGVGPSEDEARTNALKLAASNAARELTSQLTNLGVH
jgi:hypothetical protein